MSHDRVLLSLTVKKEEKQLEARTKLGNSRRKS
jgi:hypothetical protein